MIKTLSYRHDGEKEVILMTLTYIANQLYDLSVDGHFGGERYTRSEFLYLVQLWMRDPERLAIPRHYVATVTLPDGEWPFYIEALPDGSFDYWIPDTMAQATALWGRLWDASSSRRAS